MATSTDLVPGTRFTTGSRSLGGEDARSVVDLCGYTHPLFAGDGVPPMIPGQVVLALAAGLLESSARMGDDVIALVGMDGIRFHAPLAPGEPMCVDVEVADRRPTSRGDRILLDLDLTMRCGDRLLASARTTFLLTRPAGTPPP